MPRPNQNIQNFNIKFPILPEALQSTGNSKMLTLYHLVQSWVFDNSPPIILRADKSEDNFYSVWSKIFKAPKDNENTEIF